MDGIAQKEPTWGDVLKNLAIIIIIIAVAYFVTVRFGIENIRNAVAGAGIYAPLIIILLKATTLIVVPLGGMPLYPIAGALFGFWEGLGITLLGDLIGSSICFYISKYFGKSVLRFFMTKQQMPIVEKLIEKAGERKTFLKARIFFTGFPELFAYAAGFTKIPFTFFISVHIGIHAIFASFYVLFGELIVSGNKTVLIITALITSLLAFSGIWWFHASIKNST